jgi:hypothetical protein
MALTRMDIHNAIDDICRKNKDFACNEVIYKNNERYHIELINELNSEKAILQRKLEEAEASQMRQVKLEEEEAEISDLRDDLKRKRLECKNLRQELKKHQDMEQRLIDITNEVKSAKKALQNSRNDNKIGMVVQVPSKWVLKAGDPFAANDKQVTDRKRTTCLILSKCNDQFLICKLSLVHGQHIADILNAFQCYDWTDKQYNQIYQKLLKDGAFDEDNSDIFYDIPSDQVAYRC